MTADPLIATPERVEAGRGGLSYDAILGALIAQGVPRHLAEATARREVGAEEPARPVVPRTETRDVALPFRMTIPWSLLISDNERHTAAIRGGKPFVLTKTSYSQAKHKIEEIATRAAAAGIPRTEPLEFIGRVYPPRATRVDPSNFAKLVQDALSKVVYADDRWLHRVVWERAETDVDQPRAEITVCAMSYARSASEGLTNTSLTSGL